MDTSDKNVDDTTAQGQKSKRGFAAMDPEKRRDVARKGGKIAHEKGVANKFTTEKAKDAGSKGGKAVSTDRTHMVDIGRRGGTISAQRRKDQNTLSSDAAERDT